MSPDFLAFLSRNRRVVPIALLVAVCLGYGIGWIVTAPVGELFGPCESFVLCQHGNCSVVGCCGGNCTRLKAWDGPTP